MASIQKRTLQNGETSYRVQVRLKGYEVQRATFDRLTDAKKWAQSVEVALRERRHFKSSEAKKHTVGDMIDRYVKRLERDNQKRLNDIDHLLKWWKRELGFCVLADLNRSLISERLEKLSRKKVERWNRKTEKTEVNFISSATVNRYLAAFTRVGFLNSKGSHRASQEEVIRWIDEGYPFYVEVGGRRVNVIVATSRFGNKYIRTEADNDEPNNLLSLMECVG